MATIFKIQYSKTKNNFLSIFDSCDALLSIDPEDAFFCIFNRIKTVHIFNDDGIVLKIKSPSDFQGQNLTFYYKWHSLSQ